MDIWIKTLNKIPANRIHIKGIIYRDHEWYILVMQGWFNIWEEKKHLTKFNTQQKGIEGNYLHIIKATFKKPTANITRNSERLKAFP